VTSAETAGRILELRRAGVSPRRIAQELRLPEEEIQEAISEALSSVKVEEVRALELDRLDRLQQAIWAAAVGGEWRAVDRAIRLTEIRLRLAGSPDPATPMSEAYEATISELPESGKDQALIEAGRRLVRQIDSAANSGDPLLETKAMYLIPHLVNVLRELRATPAIREELAAIAAAALPAPTVGNELDEFKRRRSAHRQTGD
jgi:hypothetical protein